MLNPGVTVQQLFQGINCNQILFLLTNVFIRRLGLDPEPPPSTLPLLSNPDLLTHVWLQSE